MRILFFIVILTMLFVQSYNGLNAQKQSTPLEAQAPPKQTEIGGLIGFGYNFQMGDFIPSRYLNPDTHPCKYCKFDNGDNFGLTLGLVFERDITEDFQWGTSLRYTDKSIDASYIKYDTVALEIKPGIYEDRALPFKNMGEFDVSMISVNPYVKWSFLKFMFVRVGLDVYLLTTANINQTKELLKFRDTLATGEIVHITLRDYPNYIAQIDKREIPEKNLFQFSVSPAFGFNFEISNQLYLSPYFEFSVPFTNITNQQPEFTIANWRFMVELRLALKLRHFVNKL